MELIGVGHAAKKKKKKYNSENVNMVTMYMRHSSVIFLFVFWHVFYLSFSTLMLYKTRRAIIAYV